MFTAETVQKFAKNHWNISDKIAEELNINKYIIYYLINNFIDVHKWMDELDVEKRGIFSHMLYELGTSYREFSMLTKIVEYAMILNVEEYCCVVQMKEKFGTIRIYTSRTEKYYLEDVSADILQRISAFDNLVDGIEDAATGYLKSKKEFSKIDAKENQVIDLLYSDMLHESSIIPIVSNPKDLDEALMTLMEKKWFIDYRYQDYICQTPDRAVFDLITDSINKLSKP